MKKRKQLISSERLKTWYSPDYAPYMYTITLTKHTQCRTGISMYTLDLDGEPVVSCDSFDFLCSLVDKDFHFMTAVLSEILMFRKGYISSLESEE